MNVYHETQVPWPPSRKPKATRKNGPFQVNIVSAADRVEDAVRKFSKGTWRTKELWIYIDGGQVGARNAFLANQRGILSPRVCVRFDLDGHEYNICADSYTAPEQNLAGIAAYIESVRAQERNGIFTVEEMMHTFAALPARVHWSEVLGLPRDARMSAIESAYRARAKKAHPDVEGGSHEAMSALNAAYEEAKAEVQP